MKPVDQTNFTIGRGNCLQACLAAIFELLLREVPHFPARRDEWFAGLQEWLRPFGLGALLIKPSDAPSCTRPEGYYVALGPSANTSALLPCGVKHAVVFLNERMVHDPDPARQGLLRVDELIVFTALDPSALVRDVSRGSTEKGAGRSSS